MIVTLDQLAAVLLDGAACGDCGGTGLIWDHFAEPRQPETPDGRWCGTCHGAGVEGDLDPATLARLTRALAHHPLLRECLAAALPEARVAGPWVATPRSQSSRPADHRRYTLDGAVVAIVYRSGGAWEAGGGAWEAGVHDPERDEAGDSREGMQAWCDAQLRAAGWVLVGGAVETAAVEEADDEDYLSARLVAVAGEVPEAWEADLD
jgi:hypothetical protein